MHLSDVFAKKKKKKSFSSLHLRVVVDYSTVHKRRNKEMSMRVRDNLICMPKTDSEDRPGRNRQMLCAWRPPEGGKTLVLADSKQVSESTVLEP